MVVMDPAKLARLKRRFKKPKFVRFESWRYKRLETGWRRPKGIDNKMRLERKGWPVRVKIGYRSPKILRGLHPSGYREVYVRNEEELRRLKGQTDIAIRLSGKLGARKRRILTEIAEEMGLKVLNPYKKPRLER